MNNDDEDAALAHQAELDEQQINLKQSEQSNEHSNINPRGTGVRQIHQPAQSEPVRSPADSDHQKAAALSF